MNPLDRMEGPHIIMTAEELSNWKSAAINITKTINNLENQYNSILENYAIARQSVDENNKENIDTIQRNLIAAKAKLCALMGGKRRHMRSHKALKRTRKHRR